MKLVWGKSKYPREEMEREAAQEIEELVRSGKNPPPPGMWNLSVVGAASDGSATASEEQQPTSDLTPESIARRPAVSSDTAGADTPPEAPADEPAADTGRRRRSRREGAKAPAHSG